MFILFTLGTSSMATSMQGVNRSAIWSFHCLKKKNILKKKSLYRDSKYPVVKVGIGGQRG